LVNFLWDLSATILWTLYAFALGLYLYGIIKNSLVMTLSSVIICTIFAFVTSWSVGPYVVFLLIFQQVGILIMVILKQKKLISF